MEVLEDEADNGRDGALDGLADHADGEVWSVVGDFRVDFVGWFFVSVAFSLEEGLIFFVSLVWL